MHSPTTWYSIAVLMQHLCPSSIHPEITIKNYIIISLLIDLPLPISIVRKNTTVMC